MGTEEPFSWNKFFDGLIHPINFAKSFVTLVQICLILLVIISTVFAGYSLWKKLKPKVKTLVPIEVTTNTGTVHSSTDDNRRKICFFSLCF